MPSPGDLIEFSRELYKHWAVYVGDGYVVHLVNSKTGGFSSSSSSSNSGKTSKSKGKILKQKLSVVEEGDSWKVKNKYDHKHDPRPAQEIVDEAESMVGDDVDYDLISYNCEHFATLRRYGKSECAQVENRATQVYSAIGGVLGCVGGPLGAAAGAAAGAGLMKLGFKIGKLFD